MLPTLQILRESMSSTTLSQSTRKNLEHLLIYEDQVQEQLGLDFIRQMESAWDAVHAEELDRAYEEGFLAAFRLWMDISSTHISRT